MSLPKHKRTPVPFTKVSIQDAFWRPRMAANRERGLVAVYQQLKETGRLAAYELDWQPGLDRPAPHVFWDSDVAKWLEGACYSLMTHPDQELLGWVEDVVDRILSAQGEDGYINPHFTVVDPGSRWTNLRDKHELYCAGHLIEAAIAHHQATGDDRFLLAMQRYADLIDRTFGPGEEQMRGYPGHEELELALIRLYRHTREKRYLDLARFFIEERGRTPLYFETEAKNRGEGQAVKWQEGLAHYQAHRPIREQRQVVGHAVRAMYLYCGVTDLAAETGDEELQAVLQTLWEDLTHHKVYLTGGIGPSPTNEGFTKPYDLPNRDAYAETCAAIGLVFWAQRMLNLDLDSRYADILERALYNGMLSGVSLEGDRFFYVNPLSSDGAHHRQPFYACSCCPPNINRILPKIGEYIYSQRGDEVALHLYIQSEAEIPLKSGPIRLVQETDYPWDGIVCISLDVEEPVEFTLQLRRPGWCRDGRIYLNGTQIPVEDKMTNGYITLKRQWHPGDELRLQWLMPVTRVYAHPQVRSNTGRTALMRGPLVYCLEAVDQSVPVHNIFLPRKAGFDSEYDPEVLDGVVTIHGTAKTIDPVQWEGALYLQEQPDFKAIPFKAVPYYAWDNRQAGEMQVWFPEAPE